MQNVNSSRKFNIPLSRLSFYFGMGAIFTLILLRNLVKVNLPVMLILAISIVMLSFASETEIIAFAICCIPLGNAFQFKYAILFAVLIYIVKYGKNIRFTWVIIPILSMFVWELLHAIGSEFSFIEYLRGFSELILCLVLLLMSNKDFDYWFVVKTLSVCTVFVMTIMIINLLIDSGFDVAAIFEGQYRFGAIEESGGDFALNYNSNILGYMCNVCIAGLLQRIVAKQHKKGDFVLIVLLALFGIMTMSRSFILCFALLLVLFLFARKEPIVEKIKKLIYIVVGVMLIILLAKWLMPTVVQTFKERFTETEDITNGRSDLLVFFNQHIASSPKYSLFGIGMQNVLSKLTYIYGFNTNVPHNGFQELIVLWGVPGLILFIVFIVSIINTASRENKPSLSAYMILILILVKSISGQLITAGSMILGVCLAYLSMCAVKRR